MDRRATSSICLLAEVSERTNAAVDPLPRARDPFVVAALACVATCFCSSRRPKGAALLDDASTHVL